MNDADNYNCLCIEDRFEFEQCHHENEKCIIN